MTNLTIARASPWYDLPILGPYAIAITNLTTVSSSVLAADSARTGVWFHNPGTKNKRIMPAGSVLAGGAGGILLGPQQDYALLKAEDSQYNINCEWIAVTDDNTEATLTILNFTPNTPGAAEVQPTTRLLQQISIVSPTGTQVTGIGIGSSTALAADPNRLGVEFFNPSVNTLAVCPSNLAAAIGAGSILLYPGVSKTIMGNDRVKVNCGWNVIADSGAANQLTALSFYG